MTDHVALQEDQLELPDAWNAKLLPWRGRRGGAPVELADPEWLGRWKRGIARREGQLRAALAIRANARHATAAEAYMEGRPDPRGAAAIATLMLDYDGRSEASWLRPEFDCWLLEHGLAFATAAAVERLAVAPVTDGKYGGQYGGTSIVKRRIFEHELVHPETLSHELDHGGIAAVRSLLADASDEEYAEVVAAVAAHRDSAPKRMAAMLLLPTEHDWVLESCTEYGKARYWSTADMVVAHAASRVEHLAAARIVDIHSHLTDAEIIAVLLGGLGTDALPFFLETDKYRQHWNDDSRRHLYRAIALMPRDDATAFVFERLDRPNVWEAANTAATRFPVRALRVAASLAPAVPAETRLWITAVASRIDPALHAHLDESDRAVLADLLTDDARVPPAAVEDLPPLLVAPPWTRKRAKVKQVVIEGLQAPTASHLVWAAGEFEAWSRGSAPFEHDEWFTNGELNRELYDWSLVSVIANARPERAEPFLEHWDGSLEDGVHEHDLKRMLARYGERVVGRLLKIAAANHDCQVLPGPILDLAAARIAAERLGRFKSARPSAIEWFDRHGLAAVPYLVPDALGSAKLASDKKRRKNAESALLHLADSHGGEAVAAAAGSFGPDAAAAIAAILDVEPLAPRVKVPRLADWVIPLILPQVLLKGGERALPAESVRHLVTVLALGTPDYDYRGVAIVAEACDRDSLARFSRALFDRWTAVGAPGKDGWALTQLAHFADDAAVWDLAARIREWPGESLHRRAVTGLEVLGAIGTEEAMRAIQAIADKVKFRALRSEAAHQVSRIAEELGLTREQLADRLVPDFGLGDEDALVFDYGPRRFFVAFDEQLKPFVRDGDGKPRKSLPKPSAKDDPELAEESYRRFAALRKELRSVATEQVRRFEAAMVSGRDWSAEEFRRCFAEHALIKHLARRVVWLAESGGRRFGFRIAEDGTFSDVEDDTVALDATARIRIAHPVHLGASTAAWAAVLADYEILQPFDQLNRPIMTFTDDELATGRLKRFEGATVDVGRVLGLTQRGWNRAAPEDGGVAPGIAYPLPGGGFVVVSLDPGIWVGAVGEAPDQTVMSVGLDRSERYERPDFDQVAREAPRGIDPVAASEALASLARLTGTA